MAMHYGTGTNQTIGNPYDFLDRNRPRKIVFYGRVSTEHEAQLSALENQIKWYDDQAAYHPNWTVLDKYIDEGITGTQAKKRPAFLRMIEDAHKGRFDLIVTREVCRFARNTVDTLVTTRELKNMGIEVYFVEDNIWTMDGDGELRLAIMATLAQEESRKVSERVKAGQMISREKKTIYGNGNILGYNREGSTYVINEEQAKVVRFIYETYSQGKMGYAAIAGMLTRQGMLNASGNDRWGAWQVGRILANPTYIGYQAYGKSYSNNYLEQKRINNYDISTYMMVKADFEPIISEELWQKCQQIRENRIFEIIKLQETDNALLKNKTKKGRRENNDLWASKLRCSCGATFRKNRWHKNNNAPWSYGYECYNQLNNGSRSQRIKNGANPEGYCGQGMIADWKLNLMAEKIIEHIWGDRKPAIELACRLIKECYKTDTRGGTTILPGLISSMDKLRKKKEVLLEILTEGRIDKEEFSMQREKIDKELEALQEEYKIAKEESEDVKGKPDICWDKIMETLNQITDPNGDQEEIIRNLVSRIVPDGKWKFRWYMNLDGENETALDVVVEGNKKHAIVNINADGAEEAPQPLHMGRIYGLNELKNSKKSSPLAILDRLRSRSRGNNPGKPLKIAELTVDEAYAREFVKTAPSVHYFKTSQWKDIRIDIFI